MDYYSVYDMYGADSTGFEINGVSASEEGKIDSWMASIKIESSSFCLPAEIEGLPVVMYRYYGGKNKTEFVDSVDLSRVDMSNAVTFEYMMGSATAREIKFPNISIKKSGISMHGMFRYSTFETVDFNGMSAEVSDLQGVFSASRKLININFGNIRASKCKSISNMFSFCGMIDRIDLRALCLRDIRDFHAICHGCTTLKKFEFNGEVCSSDGINARASFMDCVDLEEVVLPDMSKSETLMYGVFWNCNKLRRVRSVNDKGDMDLGVIDLRALGRCTDDYSLRSIFGNTEIEDSSGNRIVIAYDNIENDLEYREIVEVTDSNIRDRVEEAKVIQKRMSVIDMKCNLLIRYV